MEDRPHNLNRLESCNFYKRLLLVWKRGLGQGLGKSNLQKGENGGQSLYVKHQPQRSHISLLYERDFMSLYKVSERWTSKRQAAGSKAAEMKSFYY